MGSFRKLWEASGSLWEASGSFWKPLMMMPFICSYRNKMIPILCVCVCVNYCSTYYKIWVLGSMGAASGLGSLYAGRGDYSSSNSGHFGEKADKGYVPNLGYRTARGDYAAPYGSSPSSRYGAGMVHPRGNRLPDDLEQLLSDAAAYRNRHRLASLCFQLLKLIILARSL